MATATPYDTVASHRPRNAANIGFVTKHLPLLVACLLASPPLPAMGAGATYQATDRIIVKWRTAESDFAPASEARVRTLAARVGTAMTRGRSIGGAMSVVHLDRRLSGAELAGTLQALRADPEVELAEPDRRVKAQAYTPSDPLFTANQWYLQGIQVSAIRVDTAWEITRGGTSPAASTTVVAVLDTGVRLDHPDLAGKLLPGYDFISTATIGNDGDGWDADPSDAGDFLTAQELASSAFRDGNCGGGPNSDQPTNSSWHGTRVSGLIAANTDNGEGIAGTAFNIRVVPVRVLGKCGGFESDVLAGMYWAAGLVPPPPLLRSTDLPTNAHPAQILNMSLGVDGACSATYQTAVRDVTARGVLIVASAGNDGNIVGSPASCTGALAVAGIRHAGTKVGYSNLGPEIAIAAPAGNCFNIDPTLPCVYALNTTSNQGLQGPTTNFYSSPTAQPTFGTSFSTPLVAGVAGLMKTVNPALTPAVLIARLKETARAFPAVSDTTPQPPVCQLPASAGVQATECICTTAVCGAGMLDAAAAVRAAQRPVALAQLTGTVGAGRTLILDGSQSAASIGRSIVSYAWTVDSVTGGAATPVISAANTALASLPSPTQGVVILRLTITDNLGGADFATITITGTGGSSSSPPPVTTTSGGGGNVSIYWVLLAIMLLSMRRRARK